MKKTVRKLSKKEIALVTGGIMPNGKTWLFGATTPSEKS